MRLWTITAAAACLAVAGVPRWGSLDAREKSDAVEDAAGPSAARYHRVDEIRALLGGWAAEHPERLRLSWIDGDRHDGLPVLEILRAAGSETDATEPTRVMLVGGPEGRSAIGTEALLRAGHTLIQQLDTLPSHLEVILVPTCAPDALERVVAGELPDGRVGGGGDEDGDGDVDEDGPDDLDGDGQVLEMLLEDPDGPWCLARDGRTLLLAGEQDAPRFTRTVEGRDDDGDGDLNEDGGTGVDVARQFPVGWTGPSPVAGHRPLSDRSLRALALWIATRRPHVALLFGGQHGGVHVHPREGLGQGDRVVAEALGESWERATGRIGAMATVGAPREGQLGDWLSGVLGCVTVEVAPWGPGVVGLDGRPLGPAAPALDGVVDGSVGGSPPGDRTRESALRSGRRPTREELAWTRWLDEVRGGVGFVDWHPVDLGGGRTGYVGGWEPRSRWNPRDSEIEAAIHGVGGFVEEVIDDLPRLEIEVLEAEREGRLVRLTIQVSNEGALPTSALESGSLSGARGVEVRVEAACEISLLAGTPVVQLDEGLLAHGRSHRISWLMHVDEGATLVVQADGPDGLGVTRELRP